MLQILLLVGWCSIVSSYISTSKRPYNINSNSKEFLLNAESKNPAGIEKKLDLPTFELASLLEEMPLQEKYSLLLQSYCNRILEKKAGPELLVKMETLYNEMTQKAVRPDTKGTQSLVDAASSYCNIQKMATALRLGKAGGSLNAFGAINSQLTTPVLDQKVGSFGNVVIPVDDREVEVLFASIVGAASLFWISLQGFSFFNEDFKGWTTLYSFALLGIGGLDVAFREAKSIKLAIAGLDRLILADADRQAHCDGAAFLGGYLLGLPCYCFRPDVSEALKMVRLFPDSLSSYKQPLARGLKQSSISRTMSGKGSVEKTLNKFVDDLKSGFSTPVSPKIEGSKAEVIFEELDKELAVVTNNGISEKQSEKDRVLDIGRVLIWLMIPVAAENLKYGKTILSDPRRTAKFLEVYLSFLDSDKKSEASVLGSFPPEFLRLSGQTENQQALLQWSYFEAVTLVRQYGDLLEEVKGFLNAGTATVGECTLLIEEELS